MHVGALLRRRRFARLHRKRHHNPQRRPRDQNTLCRRLLLLPVHSPLSFLSLSLSLFSFPRTSSVERWASKSFLTCRCTRVSCVGPRGIRHRREDPLHRRGTSAFGSKGFTPSWGRTAGRTRKAAEHSDVQEKEVLQQSSQSRSQPLHRCTQGGASSLEKAAARNGRHEGGKGKKRRADKHGQARSLSTGGKKKKNGGGKKKKKKRRRRR